MSPPAAPGNASPRIPLLMGLLVGAVTGLAAWRSPVVWTLTMDTGSVFLGQTLPAFRTWMTGSVPEWSDLLWGGFPLLGDCTTAALYPLHLLAYVGSLDAPLRFFDVAFVLHLALFAAGSAALLGALGAGPAATATGGMLAALCPFAHYCGIAFFPVLGAQAWWPWAFVAAERLAHPGTRPIGGAMVLGWVALGAQVLVGVPEQAAYCAVAASAWLLTRRSGLGVASRVGRLVLLGAGSAAVAAPQLLPTIAYVPWTARAGDPALAELASMWLSAPEQLLVAGRGVLNGMPSFVGVVALVLAGVAVLAREPRALFVAVLAAVGLLLALGPQAGLYELLHRMPVFEQFRSPVKLYAFTEFGVVWAAALGVDALARRRNHWMRAAALALAMGAIAERAAYLPAEIDAFRAIRAADGLEADVVPLLEAIAPVRDRKPGEPPPLVLDVAGYAAGGYARSLGAIAGLSSLRAGTVALIPPAHLALPWRIPSHVLGVRYVLAPLDKCLHFAERSGWPAVEFTRDFCVLKNPRRVGRYEVLKQVLPVESEPAMLPAVRVHRNGPVPILGAPDTFRKLTGGGVTLNAYRPGHAVLTVMSIGPALLLARESRVPGWDVRVDGAPVTPFPAAGIYFAVPVGRGVHTVELTYRAPGFREGVVVLLAWAAITALWAIAARRA